MLIREDMPQPVSLNVGSGTVAVYTARSPARETANEDAAGVLSVDEARGVVVVADGFGGQPAGDQASELAVTAVVESVEQAAAEGSELRVGILAGFDRANEAVLALGVGAATTLAAIEIDQSCIRPYHVGDSEVLAMGQRGRIRFQTIAHSPVGYSVEAGLLDQTEALHHEDRHLVSNMVGSGDMRIDVGPVVRLAPRDTVVVATDGLFDNLTVGDIADVIRKGDLLCATKQLVGQCRERMDGVAGDPCKPDDLTVVAFRLRDAGQRRRT
jgi:serine/threonine protein phosphatase PrpC